MVRRFWATALVISLVLCLPQTEVWGRGGFHGGGGGGFHGGGGGGFHGSPGGFGGAPHMSGGMGAGGFSGHAPSGFGGSMGRGPSGFGGSGLGGGAQRGFGQMGGMGGVGGGLGGHNGLGAGGLGAGGLGAGGLGNHGLGGVGSAGLGNNRFSSPSRSELNNFLGLPSDSGMHSLGSVGVGAGNLGVGSSVGLGGGRAGLGAGGIGGPASGIGARPGLGAGRAGIGAEGMRPISASARYNTANAVRNNFNHWGAYDRDWYGRYPGAWYAAGWAGGYAWRACTWASAAGYCGYYGSQPMYYDYGNNVTYQDNSVYVDGESVGTSAQYYDQAQSIASTGAEANASSEGDWLPLGVFALTKSDQTKSDVTIQLAVNKQAVIRGNYTDTATNKNQVIEGSVDKETQRVACYVGDNKTKLIETGLYNLTKDEAPCLIHFSKDRTEQWLLVRLTKPDSESAPK